MKNNKSLAQLYLDIQLEECVKPLDYLFRTSGRRFKEISNIETERELALKNLRELTSQLQTKRLRFNAKSACDYFTL